MIDSVSETAPVFLFEMGGYCSVYLSVYEAERSLEDMDVRDGVYSAAFNPDGTEYLVSLVNEVVNFEKVGNDITKFKKFLNQAIPKFTDPSDIKLSTAEGLAR